MSTGLAAAIADRYRIERELGAGGMATVYLAQDLKHDRKVAIKVLRAELAAVIGAERFLAEIKTTANLQHPHILPLHDSGVADSFLYYVMPYVEGESLRDRLNREKQLPIADAIRIATEVASALDYAHRHGIIHRDIKPENILLHDGSALVADFGIALAASKASGSRMTETGMSLGTPHYMSPEQAMGEREIGPQSDVYALGAVTYEMLVGEPPFTGPTAQSIVAKVLTEEPRPLAPKRHTIPPHVESSVMMALEKLPADRFATAVEFAEALRNPGAAPLTTRALPATRVLSGARWRRWFWVAASLALLLLVMTAWGWLRFRGATEGSAGWQYVTFGDSASVLPDQSALSLSPDGSILVFRDARPGGLLWIKRQGTLNPTPILGTERTQAAAFSPDGQWIAFVADGHLKKVGTGGGGIVTLADSADGGGSGTAWLDNDHLLYVTPDIQRLMRVNASDGSGAVAWRDSALTGGGIGFLSPLPGGRGVLFQWCSSGCVTMSVHVLDLRTGRQKLLLDGMAQAWYLPGGHLLYVRRDGVGLVAPFDLERLAITGPAIPVLDGIHLNGGRPGLAWSPSGSLVFVRGVAAAGENIPVRVSREGIVSPIDTAWKGPFNSIALSPEGRRLAVEVGVGAGLSVWVRPMERGPFIRLTFGGQDRRPIWSPDGRMVAFIRDSGNSSALFARPADGSGQERPLVRLDRQLQEADWSPDGHWILVRTDNGTTGAGDIVGVRTSGDTTPVPVLASSFTEMHPAISADGRWLAYTSNESGVYEVYVRPFPNVADGRWQVSNGGGSEPRWSPDGHELYYIDASLRLIAARVNTAPTFAVAGLTPLFDVSSFQLEVFNQSYDVSPDGRTFIFLSPRRQGGGRVAQIVWVERWFSDLRARLGR